MSSTADDQALAEAKQVLRRAVRQRRASRTAVQREADDAVRTRVLVEVLDEPTCVAAYLSAGDEPGTLATIAWLAAHDVAVLLPVLSRGPAPRWAPYLGPDALQPGRHGILEPTTDPLPDGGLVRADLVLVPGLAATRAGDRLGRGGGWYDRALADAPSGTPVWVLLNDDEVFDAVPAQAWDRPVDALVTPGGLLPCSGLRATVSDEVR